TTTAAKGASCVDQAAPKASVASLKVTGGRLALSGKASDKAAGCRATGVASVQVTVTRAAGAKKCEYLLSSYKLSKATTCSAPYALVAHGKTAWTLKSSRKLPKGKYAVTVKALDAAGNAKTLHRSVTVR
ncbi:MAG TPA: Ig-like domain-containing protein, partial [Baekduia sp.]|nr:Ig-like domain-containing protein [Baekduia sp.]